MPSKYLLACSKFQKYQVGLYLTNVLALQGSYYIHIAYENYFYSDLPIQAYNK